jgi:hypothetical protein
MRERQQAFLAEVLSQENSLSNQADAPGARKKDLTGAPFYS